MNNTIIRNEANEDQNNPEKIGRISEVNKNSFKIRLNGQEISARLKGNLYEEDAEKIPVVGDYVKFMYTDIREGDDKGRHTTTYRKLIEIPGDVAIIDTPGMREVGMANAQEGIDETFSDILELESMCKFSNCRHETEPGCAIRAAVANGELSAERFELYINLGRENTKNHAMKKEISKWAKARKKIDKRNSLLDF